MEGELTVKAPPLTASVPPDWMVTESERSSAPVLPRIVPVVLATRVFPVVLPEFLMRTYTDAPLLVRVDTGKRLRESDLTGGEPEPNRFTVWDEATATAVPTPKPPDIHLNR